MKTELDERKQRALETYENTLNHIVIKGRLLLTVEVTTREQAKEILEWMYAPEKKKPMKADLLELAWDTATVTQQEFEALKQLKAALIGG